MRYRLYSVFFILCILCASCKDDGIYLEKAKSLDSLSGALSRMVNDLEAEDTVTLQKAITKFTYYRQFIDQNVNDTLQKNEADQLRVFFTQGANLERYAINRKILRQRAGILEAQIELLSADAKRKSISHEALLTYFMSEKKEASQLLHMALDQQRSFHSSLEQFKNSLNGVEIVIRSRNNGELPKIIRDTLSL